MPAGKNGGKSVLMTPDPYHTPGYCGFCPQFKFQIGETFGKTTSHLLTNPNVACSGQPVLADVRPAPGPESPGKHYTAMRAKRCKLLQNRKASFGDQKLGDKMVPGYTGYIPKGQHFYGDRYAEFALNAISDFEQDQVDHRDKQGAMARIRDVQEGREKPNDRERKELKKGMMRTPLRAVCKVPPIYRSQCEKQYSTSPYCMNDDNPRKCFVSGYTGFVPKARGLLGIGYPVVTNRALNEFTGLDHNRFTDLNTTAAAAQGVCKGPPWLVPTPPKEAHTVYHRTSGLVPLYTGHIPGQKFRYGTTFGRSTRNAKRLPVEISIKPKQCNRLLQPCK